MVHLCRDYDNVGLRSELNTCQHRQIVGWMEIQRKDEKLRPHGQEKGCKSVKATMQCRVVFVCVAGMQDRVSKVKLEWELLLQ